MDKKYKIQLTKDQISILNTEFFNDNKRKKYMSVLAYISKNINLETYSLEISLDRLFKRYSGWKGRDIKMSRTYFIGIANNLVDLGILLLKKIGRFNRYVLNLFSDTHVVNEKVNEKVNETNLGESVEESHVREDFENYKALISNQTIYTDTNINMDYLLEYYKNSYKGISGNPVAKKRELKDIAKSLMSLRGIKEPYIQALIMCKINGSNQKINIKGAINYINTMITEKLTDTTSEFIEECKELEDMKVLENSLLGW